MIAQLVMNPPAMLENLVQPLGQEDPLEKGKASDSSILGLPSGSAGKRSTCNAEDLNLISSLGRFPWRRERLPTPVFWPGEFRGLYTPWGHKESDTTERLSLPWELIIPAPLYFYKLFNINVLKPLE